MQSEDFFAPTLFKQTRPVDLILPLQNQLPHLQQIVAVDKLAPATASLAFSQLLLAPPLTQVINVHADELAAVLFTSGTEGMPKGVMLTHNNILASERAYCARLNLTWQDVFLMPAPLGHATGFLHGVTAPFLIGARSVLLDIFTPTACLELLEQQRCTCVLGATPSSTTCCVVWKNGPVISHHYVFSYAVAPPFRKKLPVTANSAALNC